MKFNKEDIEFALKVISDFKETQPRKKRQNIDRAFRKFREGESLRRLESEAYKEFLKFIVDYEID